MTEVKPGEVAFFVYNVCVPANASAATYRFWFQPVTSHGPLADDSGYEDVEVVA